MAGHYGPHSLEGGSGRRGDGHTVAPFHGWSVVADLVSFSGRACTPFVGSGKRGASTAAKRGKGYCDRAGRYARPGKPAVARGCAVVATHPRKVPPTPGPWPSVLSAVRTPPAQMSGPRSAAERRPVAAGGVRAHSVISGGSKPGGRCVTSGRSRPRNCVPRPHAPFAKASPSRRPPPHVID